MKLYNKKFKHNQPVQKSWRSLLWSCLFTVTCLNLPNTSHAVSFDKITNSFEFEINQAILNKDVPKYLKLLDTVDERDDMAYFCEKTIRDGLDKLTQSENRVRTYEDNVSTVQAILKSRMAKKLPDIFFIKEMGLHHYNTQLQSCVISNAVKCFKESGLLDNRPFVTETLNAFIKKDFKKFFDNFYVLFTQKHPIDRANFDEPTRMFIIRPDFNIELFYKMNIHLHGFDLPTEYYNKVIANIQNNLYFGRSEDAVFDHVTCFLMTIASYDIQNMENILTRMDKHDVWNYLKKNINSRQTESIWYGDLKKPIQRQLGNGSTQSMNLLKKINDLIYASEKTKENDLLNQWLKSKFMAKQLMWRHVLFAQPACQDFNGQTVQRTLCGKLVNTDSQKVHYRSQLAFLNKKMMHQKDGTIIINIENKDQVVIRQLSFSHAVLQIIDEFMMANDDHLMIQILRLGGPNIQWLVEKKWNDRARSKNIELSQHLPLCHKIEELLKDFQAQHVKKASPVQPSLGVNPISIPSAKQKTKPQLEEEESKVAQ